MDKTLIEGLPVGLLYNSPDDLTDWKSTLVVTVTM